MASDVGPTYLFAILDAFLAGFALPRKS